MAGWCHGSAGYVHLWTTAHAVLGDDRWAVLAERAAWDSYLRPNHVEQLCCGLGGQAYGLLALYRAGGDRRWIEAAAELADRATAIANGAATEIRLPASLHKGEVGLAALAVDLRDPGAAAMPFFGPAD
jgi:serine/threonine-protein kinase